MSWETALDRQIHDYLPDLKWAADEPMAKHTSFRIGGPAKRMAFPKTREQLVVLMGFLQDAGVKPLLIGNGTNLLITDGDVDRIVVQMGERMAGQSYLTFWRSVQYMVKMSISILLIQWFRKRDTETPYPERSL